MKKLRERQVSLRIALTMCAAAGAITAVICLISTGWNTNEVGKKLREIDRLQQQLRDVRFEALSISSELTGNSRQSQIELLIEEQGIDLEGAKTPPYELYK